MSARPGRPRKRNADILEDAADLIELAWLAQYRPSELARRMQKQEEARGSARQLAPRAILEGAVVKLGRRRRGMLKALTWGDAPGLRVLTRRADDGSDSHRAVPKGESLVDATARLAMAYMEAVPGITRPAAVRASVLAESELRPAGKAFAPLVPVDEREVLRRLAELLGPGHRGR